MRQPLSRRGLGRFTSTKNTIGKAEQHEHKNISLTRKPVKDCQSGFTQTTQLPIFDWFSGGRLSQEMKPYSSPPNTAYEPHTVVLAECRYAARHNPVRGDGLHHMTHVCRAGDNNRIVRPALVNAGWPWLKQQPITVTTAARIPRAVSYTQRNVRTIGPGPRVPQQSRAFHSSASTSTDVDPKFAQERARRRKAGEAFEHSTDNVGLGHYSSGDGKPPPPGSQSIGGPINPRDRSRHKIPAELVRYDKDGKVVGREHASGYQVPHTPDHRTHTTKDGDAPRLEHATATDDAKVIIEGKHLDGHKQKSPEQLAADRQNFLKDTVFDS